MEKVFVYQSKEKNSVINLNTYIDTKGGGIGRKALGPEEVYTYILQIGLFLLYIYIYAYVSIPK